MTTSNIQRGDVWLVRFDPSEGDEIQKIRPAVVMTAIYAGKIGLHIVVPLTSWKPHFDQYSFLVSIMPSEWNGLDRRSAANAFQVKSIALTRFQLFFRDYNG